jgi:acyl-CoA hydrolase
MTDVVISASSDATSDPAGRVQLIDMVFPGDTNHHGTLFGGVALAHMDKVAFLAASRHGRAPFVTAASEKIDFAAPARAGDMVEVTGRVIRVGTSSLDVEVELVAEAPVTGKRRLCTRGRFTLVAQKGPHTRLPLPPIGKVADEVGGALRLADMVFPGQTNHYGTLYGGDALKLMGKAAFIAATRHARAVMVMAASDRIDFTSPIREGEMVELVAAVRMTGRSSVRVEVALWAEDLLTGGRRHAATALFTMVSVSPEGRAKAIDGTLLRPVVDRETPFETEGEA